MKKAVFSLGLLLSIGLFSCRSASQTDNYAENTGNDTAAVEVPDTSIPNESDEVNSAIDATDAALDEFPLTVDTFTFDRLREVNAGGCGMSLWKAGESPRAEGILFFHGIDEAAYMMFEGEIQPLERTAAVGEEFYGQQSEQSFETADGAIAAEVKVTLGEPGEIESVAISEGTISIEAEGAVTELEVIGDAGC